MRTRIRELRKSRGLTLRELAEKVGTTPQTIQRLETANMTVSTTWLEKIAGALNVEVAELISAPASRDIPFLGRVGQHGAVYRTGYEAATFHLGVPADDPIAVRLEHDTGAYRAGSILIASRLQNQDYLNANGSDCLVGLTSASVLLRRILFTKAGTLIFAPLDAGAGAEFEQPLSWLARIVMTVRYA